MDKLSNGIRGIEIEHGDGATTNMDTARAVRIRFGPHHMIYIKASGGVTTFEIVMTHHGVRLDASELNGELEQAISRLRELLPDKQID